MSLFDCLIPELEAYRPIKPRLRPKWTYEENVVASTKLNKLKWKLEKSKVPQLEAENAHLHDKIDQLNNEFELLDWYIQVMEGGHNSKTLLRDFILVKSKMSSLELIHKEYQIEQEEEKQKLKKNHTETRRYLRKMQQEVVKPLLHEVTIKDKLNERQTEQLNLVK